MRTNTVSDVALADISTDGYQRDYSDPQVEAIVSGFDIAEWDLPKVVEKHDGTPGYRVVAGQHRVGAARKLAAMPASWPFDTPVGVIQCQVIGGLTSVEDEARLFLRDDRNTRRLSPFDRHRAGLVAMDPTAIDVQFALDAVGIPLVHKQRHQNGKTMSAIGALNNIWGMGGLALLMETLTVVAAWPDTDLRRTEGYLVGGLAVYISNLQTAGTYNQKGLLRKLSRVQHQPTSLWSRAMGYAAASNIPFNSYRPYTAVLGR